MKQQCEDLLDAAKVAVLNFERIAASNPDALEDDDFEAWSLLSAAILVAEAREVQP